MLRHDVAVWGARRVMWRQADNPLAPGDKYKVRRTFSAASLHSVSRGKKKKEGPPCSHHANPTAEPRREVSHQITAATDRPLYRPHADTRIFFSYLTFLPTFTFYWRGWRDAYKNCGRFLCPRNSLNFNLPVFFGNC